MHVTSALQYFSSHVRCHAPLLCTGGSNDTRHNQTRIGVLITYTATLTNGAAAVPATQRLAIATNTTGASGLTCRMREAGASSETPIAALPLSAGLPAYASLTCTFSRTTAAPNNTDYGVVSPFFVRATTTSAVYAPAPSIDYAQPANAAEEQLFTGFPCVQCRACLRDMTEFIISGAEPLLSVRDKGEVAARFSTHCKDKGRNTNECDAIAEWIYSASGEGNPGKRAGVLCQALGECKPQLFERGCSLATPSIVPAGVLSNCSVVGTNGTSSLAIPGVVAPGTNLTAGLCRTNTHCPASQLCDVESPIGEQCVCNGTTAEDTCTSFYACVDTPCTMCRTCFGAMQAFVATPAISSSTNSSAIAEGFIAACRAARYSAAECGSVAADIRASYLGALGKRPGWLCRALDGCPASGLPSDCVVKPNTTASGADLVRPVNISLCTTSGLVPLAAAAAAAAPPNNTCDRTRTCNTSASEVCNFAGGAKHCVCNDETGEDTCTDLGVCVVPNCVACSSCVAATTTWVRGIASLVDAGAIAASWQTHCTATLGAPAGTCSVVRTAIADSFQGTVGKRAGGLCTRINREHSAGSMQCMLLSEVFLQLQQHQLRR